MLAIRDLPCGDFFALRQVAQVGFNDFVVLAKRALSVSHV